MQTSNTAGGSFPMLSRILSSAVLGIDAYIVQVEVDIAQGLPAFATVGLAEGAVRESKERVKAAIKNSGFTFPSDRITVNLAPADIRKEGSAFDLPIALGILAATGSIPACIDEGHLFLGELALDGSVRPVKGILPIAAAARSFGFEGIFLPGSNAAEAAVVRGIDVFPVESLSQVAAVLNREETITPASPQATPRTSAGSVEPDYNEVLGQEDAKRALEIAAAGGHNVLMIGPPGAGKTMLARRLPTILPELGLEESLETSKVYSVMWLMPEGGGLLRSRPFRSPHHTISDAGLVGGGYIPMPGEVSLAHNGVLFLDELPEFHRGALEVMRQPMEDGSVTLARARFKVTYPARFMLVAAMNPCACGHYGNPRKECVCTPVQIQRYRSRISGPLSDRIDMHIEVQAVDYRDIGAGTSGDPSALIRGRVDKAREIQRARFEGEGIYANAQMTNRHLRRFCPLGAEPAKLLDTAMQRLALSARAYTRIIKLARTIADLEGSEPIGASHVAEAIGYRTLDRA